MMNSVSLTGHTRFSTWLIEVVLDTILLSTLFNSLMAISFSRNGGSPSSALGILVIAFFFAIAISLFFKAWSHYPLSAYLRIKKFKKNNRFSMLDTIKITFLSWVISFFVIIRIPSMLIGDISTEEFLSIFQIYNTQVFTLQLGLLLPALIAPILTYRLTGYCFDSDFSLPPWSHGRWGFGKPTQGPATAPALPDDTDPNAPPPASTGGGG